MSRCSNISPVFFSPGNNSPGPQFSGVHIVRGPFLSGVTILRGSALSGVYFCPPNPFMLGLVRLACVGPTIHTRLEVDLHMSRCIRLKLSTTVKSSWQKLPLRRKKLGELGTPEDCYPGESSPRRKNLGELLPGGLLPRTGVGASNEQTNWCFIKKYPIFKFLQRPYDSMGRC